MPQLMTREFPIGTASTVGRAFAIGAVVAFGLTACAAIWLSTRLIFDRDRRRRSFARISGRLLRRCAIALGPAFIKLGQVMSTRPDLFAPELIEEIRKLQDRLPAFSAADARATIREDLGVRVEELFQTFDETPIAAGSVAQVHRAVLMDGTEVAVKILRPGVGFQARRDGRVLIGFARLLGILPLARLSDPAGHMRRFVEAIVEQTDLEREAANYELFRLNFRDIGGVVFPSVFRRYSGRHVLTMSFMRGVKIDQLPPGDHIELADLVRNTFFKMCFEDGFAHADMHPGNLLVNEDRDLVILDAGLVMPFAPEFLDQFVDFARCLVLGEAQDFAAHFRKYHRYLKDADWPAIERDIGKIMDRFRTRNFDQLEMSQMSNDIFTFFRRHHLRPVTEMTLVLVGSVTSEGIGKMLDPHRNAFKDVAMYLMRVLLRRTAANASSDAASGLLFG